MITMPILTTDRLTIRPFTMDDFDAWGGPDGCAPADAFEENDPLEWFQWTVRNYDALAKLDQPPYGDRAVVLTDTGTLIGATGFVPCLFPLEVLRHFRDADERPERVSSTPEFGVFYSLGEAFRGKGYATEAAQAMVDYAFTSLNVRRIVLNTGADNFASMRVMERLGMTVLRNPFDMPGMAVIGVLENPAGHPSAAYMTACARPSPALDRTVTSGAKPCRRSLDPSRAALHPQADIPYHRRRP